MLVETTTANETPDLTAAQSAAAGATAAPAAAPEPSPTPAAPETPAEPKSALEAALKALDKGKDAATATAAQPAGETDQTEAEQSAQGDDEAQGEHLSDVPLLAPDVFKALPKEARTAFNQLRKQVGTLRPDAERGQAVSKFLQASGVTPEEFMELQDVGALMKRDPAKAREALMRHLDRLDTALGLRLPDDIREDVDGGYISEARAAELARERAARARAESEVAARSEAEISQAIAGAVDAWEEQARRTDVDLDRKLPSIMREVKLALTERNAAGNPVRTPKEAVKIAQDAYKAVDDMLKPFRAAAASVPRAPSSAASSAPASKVPPSTALEAAYSALGRGRG